MAEKPFPFEQLPAELREAVYKELLITTGTIRIRLLLKPGADDTSSSSSSSSSPSSCSSARVIITGRDASTQRPQLWAAILRASRQTQREGGAVLYGGNAFAFTSMTALRQFTRAVARPSLALLRDVEIATTAGHRFAFWEPMHALLLRADGLRALRIALGPDDVRDRGWSDVVLELADFVRRRLPRDDDPAARRRLLDRIHFRPAATWASSGNPSFRACSSDDAPAQVRARIEKLLRLTGGRTAV